MPSGKLLVTESLHSNKSLKKLILLKNAGTGRGRETKVSRGGNTKTEGFWGELKTRRPCIRTAKRENEIHKNPNL
ncbi:hypothetical protein EBU71_08705 [bacterium]|nr:hypothetical protein [Candidatus Elulimicrobium humile]